MLRHIALSALALAATVGIAHADVYRWVDDKGEVHFSDTWVPGSTVIKSNKPRPPGAMEDNSASKSAEPNKVAASADRASQQLKDEANARAVKQDVAKTRDQQCKQAKERYEKSVQARRIYKSEKNGERDYMSDQEADTYRAQARKDVQDACGSVPPAQ
jgi:hypothetical protein